MPDYKQQELSSPPCFMHELDDIYMGYAPNSELLTQLNSLLTAECGVLKSSTKGDLSFSNRRIAEHLQNILLEKKRHVSMLKRHIIKLGGHVAYDDKRPFTSRHPFKDDRQRLLQLYYSLPTTICLIDNLLPRIFANMLYADLREMRASCLEQAFVIGRLLKPQPLAPRILDESSES